MEMKVWVDGMVRVICGLSLKTSCQDVVIALAQAMGQTGRYVLIMKLRGNEWQLGAKDCPLQSLDQLGQQAKEVQFVLRRTGPSLSDGPNRPRSGRLSSLPGHQEPEQRLGHREHRKAVSFNFGHSTVPTRAKSNSAWSPSPRASPEPRASPVPFPHYLQPVNGPSSHSKEKVFRQILQQQDRLRQLEFRLQAVEGDLETAEAQKSSAPGSAVTRGLAEELTLLEQTARQNEERLRRGEYWERQLQEEMNREQDMHRRIGEIQSSLDDYDGELRELQARSAHLGRDVQFEAHRRASRPANTPQPEEALGPLRRELDVRLQQAAELGAMLSEAETELHEAQQRLEERSHIIEELNKEVRQCNLQQFIQQAGTPPGAPPHRDPLHPQHEQTTAASHRLRSAGILEPEDQPDNVIAC